MRILFARHGETTGNAMRIRVDGRFDEGLNANGWEQAEELAKNVPHDIDIVISSNLLRTRQTAQVVAGRLGLTIETISGIQERDMGWLSGTRNDDWPKELHEKDRSQQYDYTPYGGESVEQVKVRLTHALATIKERFEGKKVLVVTHAGIIRLMRSFSGPDFDPIIENCSFEEIEI